MVNVPTNRILSDPRKIGRHHFVIEPFLPDDVRFSYNDKKNQELLQNAVMYGGNRRMTGGVRIYRELHERVRDELDRLRSRRVLFVNGICRDRSGEKIGYDLYSTRNRSSDYLIDIVDEDWVIIPVAPFFSPTELKKDTIVHSYVDKIQELNARSKTKGLGEAVKTKGETGMKFGFYQFDESMYDTGQALQQIERPDDHDLSTFKEEIRGYVNLNKHLLAMMYANIADMIPIKDEVEVHATKSSYAYQVIRLAEGYSSYLKMSNWSAYEELEFPSETDPTVLRRLKRRLQNITGKNDKKRLRDLL